VYAGSGKSLEKRSVEVISNYILEYKNRIT